MLEPKVIEAIAKWSNEGCQIATASVISTSGSTPHLQGLALVVNDKGELAGALSGGCVDGEIIEACDEVLATNIPKFLQLGKDDSFFGTGLACGGQMNILVYKLSDDVAKILSSPPKKQFVFSIAWSAQNNDLQQMIIDKDAALEITKCCNDNNGLGDWRISASNFLLNSTESAHHSISPENDIEFFERIGKRDLVLIIGESGFTDALCTQAKMLDYEVVVCEPRSRFANSIKSACEVIESWPDLCIQNLIEAGRLNSESAIIICTHDRKFDEPALQAAIKSDVGFIGALGSRKTIEDRRVRLTALGLSTKDINRIRSPLGLDIGSQSPAETAVSVFAEIIACKNGRSGKPLTELAGSIHG
jgi:xanthine dehydrogenase accessory factor